MHQYKGKLILHCGSMFSGKTSALFREVNRFLIAEYRVLATKPKFDQRYSNSDIVTHDKISLKAQIFDSIDELRRLVYKNDPEVLAIDEIHFLEQQKDELCDFLNELLASGITIVIAGLDMDYLGVPFEITKNIFGMSDYVNKHHAVCASCGSDAWISHRKIKNSDRMLLGAEDYYTPLCRACYLRERENKDAYVYKNQININEIGGEYDY